MNILTRGIIGLIIGLTGGAVSAAIVQLTLDTIAANPGSSFGIAAIFGGVIGAPTGLITGILSGMTDYRSGIGLEWAIVGAFAALGVVLSQGTRGYSAAQLILLMLFFAVPSAVVAWYLMKRTPDVVRGGDVTLRTLSIYILGVVMMTLVMQMVLNSMGSWID